VTIGAPSTQWWIQLSTAIAGGLTFATILTLFFTPSLLILGDRFSMKKLVPERFVRILWKRNTPPV
jgi:multidrug efflux pump